MAQASVATRDRHDGTPAAESAAFRDLRACAGKEKEFLEMSHGLAVECLDALERTSFAMRSVVKDPNAGVPGAFLLRPAAELAGRVFAVCSPAISIRNRTDAAIAQYKYSLITKRSMLQTLDRDSDSTDLRLQAEGLLREFELFQSKQKGKNTARGKPSVLAAGLLADQTVHDMLTGFMDLDIIARDDRDEVTAVLNRINNEYIHTDPIHLRGILSNTDDELVHAHYGSWALRMGGYLLVGSVAAVTYFGWDDVRYRDSIPRHFDTVKAGVDS